MERMQFGRALVTTMVERWRPETHCFHLPFSEHVARRIRPWRNLLKTFTEYAISPTDMDGASRVRIHSITSYLRDQLQVDLIGDATTVERVEKIVRRYMFVILGASYFRTHRGTLLAYNTWRS
ncbi:hypothetical protein KY285_001473 [Solanum tuberosum]|nr:hypothetical protein KY285_001473 [Solanum tuberosum]